MQSNPLALLRTVGTSVPRPQTLVWALLILLLCMVAGLLVSFTEAAGWQAMLLDAATGDDLGWMHFVKQGFMASSLGLMGILVLGWLWLAAGGTGARIIWLVLMGFGAVTVLTFSSLGAYYVHLRGGDPIPALLLRGLVTLGYLVGSCMLLAPSYAVWRDTFRAQDEDIWKHQSPPSPSKD